MTLAFKIPLTTSVDGATPLPAGFTAIRDPATGIYLVQAGGADIATLGLIDVAALVQATTVGDLPQLDDWILARVFGVDSNVGGSVLFNIANQDGNPITPQLSLDSLNGYGYDQLPVYTGQLVQVDQAAPQGPLAIGLWVVPIEGRDAVCCTARPTGAGGGPPP